MSSRNIDEFSICTQCLGSDKLLKMLKHPNGLECKVCTRPFDVYRWHTNSRSLAKSKKTIICITCARLKNCCQSCMLDINFHIPLDIRDAALKMAGLENLIKGQLSTRNRELRAIAAEKEEEGYRTEKLTQDEQSQDTAIELLLKLAGKLNERQVSSVKKADKPEPSGGVDITDLLAKLPFGGSLEANIQAPSFFIFGFGDEVPQYKISNWFEQFGKLKAVTVLHKAKCGFVTFASNDSTKALIESVNNNGLNNNKKTAGLVLIENKYPLRIVRSKARTLGTKNEEHQKLSLVVNKVLQQLAEKDREAATDNLKTNNKKTNTTKSIKGKSTTESKYKTVSADFEL